MAQRHDRSRRVLRTMRETQLNGVIFLAALLCVWELIAQAGMVSPLIVPPPSKILQAFGSLVWSGQMPWQILASMKRAAAGYLLAALVCVPVGILMGLFDRLYEALEVLVEMLRPIPPPVMIPVAMLFFGLGDETKIFVIFKIKVRRKFMRSKC
jgi:ABC-type nitrate/sulfonate/bicarbonate transport system permease component